MLTVFVDKVKPGMKLAEAVTNEEGQVLLPAGWLLKEEDLSLLSRAKKACLKIEGLPPHQERRLGRQASFEKGLEERFSRVPLTPTLKKIKEALKAHFG